MSQIPSAIVEAVFPQPDSRGSDQAKILIIADTKRKIEEQMHWTNQPICRYRSICYIQVHRPVWPWFIPQAARKSQDLRGGCNIDCQSVAICLVILTNDARLLITSRVFQRHGFTSAPPSRLCITTLLELHWLVIMPMLHANFHFLLDKHLLLLPCHAPLSSHS